MIVESKVGSKGELFPPKIIRDSLGLKPGDRIFFKVNNGILIVSRILDPLELLNRQPLGSPEKPEDIEKELEEYQQEQVARSVGEE